MQILKTFIIVIHLPAAALTLSALRFFNFNNQNMISCCSDVQPFSILHTNLVQEGQNYLT